jgi:hypothetical protein
MDLIALAALALDPGTRRVFADTAASALTPALVESLSAASPDLARAQRDTVAGLVARGVQNATRLRLPDAERDLRAAVALAAPRGEAREVWEGWLALMAAAGFFIEGIRAGRSGAGRTSAAGPGPPRSTTRIRPSRGPSSSRRSSSPSPSPSSSSSSSAGSLNDSRRYRDAISADEELRLRTEIKRFKVPRKYLTPVPTIALPSLLAAIAERPTCSISLEELVNDKNHLVKGVVALVQPAHEIDPGDTRALHDPASWHCFLFKAEALRGWFASSRAGPTNPMTRSGVNLAQQLFPLTTSETFV